MIWTICKISILRLWNNKQELLLAFAVPVLFFTIFALIFSRGVGPSVSQVRVSFINDDGSPESRSIIYEACKHAEIIPVTGIGQTSSDWPIESLARSLISHREVEVVVYIPAGFTTQDPTSPNLSIQLFNQGINPIGHRLVQASLAESIAMQLATVNLTNLQAASPSQLNNTGLVSTQATAPIRQAIDASPIGTNLTSSTIQPASFTQPLADHPRHDVTNATTNTQEKAQQVFESIDAFASNKHQPKVALAAAGIAVMFLLFSANGAGASLLEEREAGTLGRLLSSRLTLSQLLAGKWVYITLLGGTQLCVMFVWGALVFRLDLLGHLPGFLAMTLTTSAACASFALFLASACKSRQQLHGVSIILVLTMSAIGGSMVPRYIMSDSMRAIGKLTFNGWALDGFQKVFWYDLPLTALRSELSVLIGITLLLGAASRWMARRWMAA
jgi:ABC-2 type transport system permease protein